MENMETTIKTVDGGALASSQSLEERPEGNAAGFISREDALRELQGFIEKDQRYDMDGNEIDRISDILNHIDSSDTLLLLRIAEAVNILRRRSFEETALDFSEKALILLEKIQTKTKSFLVRSSIDFFIQTSSSFLTIKEKRSFLERDWEYISTEVVSGHPNLYEKYYGSDASVIQNISDDEVYRLFKAFQEDSFLVVEHNAIWEIYQQFHDPDIASRYDIPLPRGSEDIPEFESRNVYFDGARFVEEIPSKDGRIIGPISDRYGIVYSVGFNTEFLFALDSDGEKKWEKDKGKREKLQVEKLSVEDVLKREGFLGTGEKSEQKLHDAGYLYSLLIRPYFRGRIEDDFGIELKDFSVRTQVQFLNFLFEKNEEEVRKVISFLKNGNATDRLTSFLSLEQGGAEMGEKILAIGEKLPKEAADRVFAKYAEMAERAGEARKNSEKDADAIEAKLLERGKSLLSWIAEHAENFAHDERLLSALNERLENLNVEIVLVASALRVAKENGNEEGIKEFLDGSFRILKGADLSEGTIAEMENLYRMSYPSDREEQFREESF